jgi:hypothetical protein
MKLNTGHRACYFKRTVKVLLFAVTNFRGFYKMHVKVLEIRLNLIEKHTHTFKKVPGHS